MNSGNANCKACVYDNGSHIGIRKDDTVAVMLPNTPPMVEAPLAMPMAGAVLNTLNFSD